MAKPERSDFNSTGEYASAFVIWLNKHKGMICFMGKQCPSMEKIIIDVFTKASLDKRLYDQVE